MAEVNPLIDLYDHEIAVIGEVIAAINASSQRPRDMEGFRKEVVERFGLAGFVAKVTVFETNVPGVYIPEIEIVGRVEHLKSFDHERQAWEVQRDILGVDDNPGALQPDGTVRTPSQSTAFIDKG